MGAKAQEYWAEGVGFEPTRRFRLVVFKTTAFDRSATPPADSARESAASPQQYIVPLPHSASSLTIRAVQLLCGRMRRGSGGCRIGALDGEADNIQQRSDDCQHDE